MIEKKEIPGKVKRNGRKFEIIKGNAAGEIDLTIELSEDGNYTVEKLDVEGLPKTMPEPDGRRIQWFNNFVVKTGGRAVKYSVTIPGLVGKTKVVVCGSNGVPSEVDAVNGKIELSDGDPGIGKTT
jgi:hypothetical protein